MRLACIADCHLGHRRYTRTAPGGTNQREQDVAVAFRRAMGEIRAAKPDLITIAGDLFDQVRPPNGAVTLAFAELQHAVEADSNVQVVIAGGDHSIPRSAETGCILELFSKLPRVHVAWRQPQRFALPCGIVSAVPAVVTGVPPHALPDPEGVLVLHGEITGTIPEGDRLPYGFAPEQLDGWRFVALGHYHTHTIVRPNAAYSGSLEYVATDAWGEARSGISKGWMLVDVPETGAPSIAFHPIPTRRYVDLAGFDASGMAAAELDLRIAQLVDEAEIADTVVRLVVTGVTRELRTAIDHAAIREYKGRALCFHLDLRRADSMTSTAARIGEFRKLDDIVKAFLGERPLPADVDRNEFIREGLGAFREDPYTGKQVA
jgi:DNA repair exonuclease SbcCD nuclease subunit